MKSAREKIYITYKDGEKIVFSSDTNVINNKLDSVLKKMEKLEEILFRVEKVEEELDYINLNTFAKNCECREEY